MLSREQLALIAKATAQGRSVKTVNGAAVKVVKARKYKTIDAKPKAQRPDSRLISDLRDSSLEFYKLKAFAQDVKDQKSIEQLQFGLLNSQWLRHQDRRYLRRCLQRLDFAAVEAFLSKII